MTELTWEYILKSQQEDFLARLKRSTEIPNNNSFRAFLSSGDNYYPEFDYYPFEIVNIYFHYDEEKEYEIDSFCTDLTWKFGEDPEDNPDAFINHKLGKIGEEAVRLYLGELISPVDYEIYAEGVGDGGIDFTLAKNSKIAIQVKTTAPLRITCQEFDKDPSIQPYIPDEVEIKIRAIESANWQVNYKGINKNHVTIFVLLMNEIIGDELTGDPYECLIAGFLPKNALIADRKYKINELLHSGGIRPYLKHLSNMN